MFDRVSIEAFICVLPDAAFGAACHTPIMRQGIDSNPLARLESFWTFS
jgi:hypothetical protein